MIAILPLMFAIAHMYMGKVMDWRVYPPFGRDFIAYAVMTLAMGLVLRDWLAIAYLPAFWLFFAPNPAKRVPWDDDRHWWPNGRYEPVRDTLVTLLCRYGGLYAIPLAICNSWFFSPLAGLLTLPLSGAAMAGGYWLGTKFWDKGDKAGKLASGALLGVMMIIAGVL